MRSVSGSEVRKWQPAKSELDLVAVCLHEYPVLCHTCLASKTVFSAARGSVGIVEFWELRGIPVQLFAGVGDGAERSHSRWLDRAGHRP